MSSKLKRKSTARQASRIPFSNMYAQHMQREFHATHADLKKLEEDAYKRGWDTSWNIAEDWANAINSITIMMALREVYGFGQERIMRVMDKANEYIINVRDRKMKFEDIIQDLEGIKIFLADDYKQIIKEYTDE